MPSPTRRVAPVTRGARWRLGVAAVAGACLYQIVLVGPLAAMMLMGVMLFGYGLEPALVAIGVIAWSLQPHHEVPGRAVSRHDAPLLHAMVGQVARATDAPAVHEVRLTDDFNAGALEMRMRWQPWRTRRVLLLGVPLLALVDEAVLRAVVAHELGHFSRRHGRLGHWIYRARAGWLSYAHLPPHEVPLFERAAAAFARWFTPRFSVWSFSYSRQCEYEADADGAAMVGARAMATALCEVSVLASRWRDAPFDDEAASAGPTGRLSGLQRATRIGAMSLEEWDRLSARACDPGDTHPSLVERIGALGVDVRLLTALAEPPGPPVGETCLPDWPRVVAEHDAAWRLREGPAWRDRCVRIRHQRQRLEALRREERPGFEWAWLERTFGNPGAALQLAGASPEDEPGVAFALQGFVLLERGDDDEGGRCLEAAVRQSSAWAPAARDAMSARPGVFDSDAARDRNARLLSGARTRLVVVHGTLHRQLWRGEVPEAAPAPWLRGMLVEVLSAWSSVAAAWYTRATLVQDGRHHDIVAVMLRLRPDRLVAEAIDEDDARVRMADVLREALRPSIEVHVWTAFTTEGLPPALDARLGQLVDMPACLVRPAPGEAAPPAVRAAALG